MTAQPLVWLSERLWLPLLADNPFSVLNHGVAQP